MGNSSVLFVEPDLAGHSGKISLAAITVLYFVFYVIVKDGEEGDSDNEMSTDEDEEAESSEKKVLELRNEKLGTIIKNLI